MLLDLGFEVESLVGVSQITQRPVGLDLLQRASACEDDAPDEQVDVQLLEVGDADAIGLEASMPMAPGKKSEYCTCSTAQRTL